MGSRGVEIVHRYLIKKPDGTVAARSYGPDQATTLSYANDWISKQPGYQADVVMTNAQGNVTPQFSSALEGLKALGDDRLIGWQLEPYDTAALFLVALLEFREHRKVYLEKLDVRFNANLQSLMNLDIPSKAQINNLKLEANTLHGLPNAEWFGGQYGVVKNRDPRAWGTSSNAFLTEPRRIIYGAATRSERGGDQLSDRNADHESAIYHLIDNEIGVANTSLLHNPRLGYYVPVGSSLQAGAGQANISFDMFFNLYALALIDGDEKQFWDTMYSYRFFTRREEVDEVKVTAIYLASCDPYTGAPKNGGQLAALIDAEKDQAISQFKQYFPYILPADYTLPSEGSFELSKELSGWAARSDKSNFQYIIRVHRVWDWSPLDYKQPENVAEYGRLFAAATDYKKWSYADTADAAWRKSWPSSENITTKAGKNSRMVTHMEVFVVPTATVTSISDFFRKIPQTTLSIWKDAMDAWRTWVDQHANGSSLTPANAPNLISWYSPSASSLGKDAFSRGNASNYHRYLANRTWDTLLITPKGRLQGGRPTTTGFDMTQWTKMNGLKALIDYFNSTAWLRNPYHGTNSYPITAGKAASLGLPGVYTDESIDAMNTYISNNISRQGIMSIYKTPVDGIDDIVNVVKQLKNNGVLSGMSEVPVFDVPHFSIKFAGDTNIYDSPFAQKEVTGSGSVSAGVVNLPYLSPVLEYRRSVSDYGAGISKWLHKRDHGISAVSRTFPQIEQTSNVLTYSTHEIYRYPVYTQGISGKMYGRRLSFPRTDIPSAVNVSYQDPMFQGTSDGFVSLPMATGITAVLFTAFWALGSGRNN